MKEGDFRPVIKGEPDKIAERNIAKTLLKMPKGTFFHHTVIVSEGFENAGCVVDIADTQDDAQTIAKGMNASAGGGFQVGPYYEENEKMPTTGGMVTHTHQHYFPKKK